MSTDEFSCSWCISTWKSKLQLRRQACQVLQQKKNLCCVVATKTTPGNWAMQSTICMRVVSYPYAAGLGPATEYLQDQVIRIRFLRAQATTPCKADMSHCNYTRAPCSCRLALHELVSIALHIPGAQCMSCGCNNSVLGAGNGLIQLVNYRRDEFEWRHQGSAGGILNLALQSQAQ